MSSPSAELVLASSSRYRRAILDKIALPYHTSSPNIDETAKPCETAEQLVARLAEQKARAVACEYPGALIIGSDQVAALDGQILGKPHTVERAVEQLSAASGQVVTFYTGLCLLDARDNSYQVATVPFAVHFRDLSLAEIERYIELESPLDCAGSFKSEGLGISLFQRLEGEDPNTLIGLPLIKLLQMLRNKGVNPLS